MENTPLLRTKLQVPQVAAGLVVRPRLLAQLNKGLGRPLTLVCAAAGFGKTTLVSSWIESLAQAGGADMMPAAWLSLDERDSELSIFLRYFIAALRTIFPGACPETLEMLSGPKDVPLAVLFPTFINELASLPRDFILVLDDHQAIHGDAVHELLNELTRHSPSSLHLVLISRYNPPLPLARLRAKGLIAEIYSHDLRFTPEETGVYLSRALPAQREPLGQQATTLLAERMEGWIAGLQIAALSLRTTNDAEALMAALSRRDFGLADYLMEEVVLLQPSAVQTFLLRTSVANQFCLDLCDAIGASVDAYWDAQACIDSLKQANLFITLLDDHGGWYRYHHLFRDVLQQRLLDVYGAVQVAAIHRKAAAWFAGQGYVDEALQHAVAAGDLELAARLMEQGLRDVLNREDRLTLERWLRLLPEEFINGRPSLLMIKAWIWEFIWLHKAQWKLLDKLEELLEADGEALPEDNFRLLRGQIAGLRGQEAYLKQQPERAVPLLQECLALLPDSWRFVRSGAMMYLCLSLQASGQGEAAEGIMLEDYQAIEDKTSAYALRLLNGLAAYHHVAGHPQQVAQISRTLLDRAEQGNLNFIKSWAHFFLGQTCYDSNDLVAAVRHFGAIVEQRHTASMVAVRGAITNLALIQQFHGKSSAAWEMAELKSRLDISEMGRESDDTLALRASLALMEGDMAGATRWAGTFAAPVAWPMPWVQPPHMTKAMIFLARGAEADLSSALDILDRLMDIVTRAHNTRYQIEILAMRAAALDGLGKNSAAEQALRAAIALSQPGGFVRIFVQLGPRMEAMLTRLAAQAGTHEYAAETISWTLAAFATGRPVAKNSHASEAQPPRPTAAASPDMIERLTPRELEILTLLQEPMTAKEIARRLYIAPATAEYHIANLYAKLGVNRRRDALARASNLGILRAP
jgi:LuxR family transcriptional regulator, maltose regulon positive regulatory protein